MSGATGQDGVWETVGGRLVPGEVIVGDEPIELFGDRSVIEVEVVNTGDRPVQVGSHYHFAEVNPALAFDRVAARGHRLAIAPGTAVRFEPGIERVVPLVPFGGRQVAAGFRGEFGGSLADTSTRTRPEARTVGRPAAEGEGRPAAGGEGRPAAGSEE